MVKFGYVMGFRNPHELSKLADADFYAAMFEQIEYLDHRASFCRRRLPLVGHAHNGRDGGAYQTREGRQLRAPWAVLSSPAPGRRCRVDRCYFERQAATRDRRGLSPRRVRHLSDIAQGASRPDT